MAAPGRPPFKATPTMRRKVEELVSCGMKQEDIARAVGCSHPTLRQHFGCELAGGLAKKRAEVIGLLYRQAKKGNVTAQKKLEEMTRLAGAEAAFNEPRQPALGKKEQAADAAKTAGAGTGWGDDLETPSARLN